MLPFLFLQPLLISCTEASVSCMGTDSAEGSDEQERCHAELLADHKYTGLSGIMSSQRLQQNNL